MHEQLVASHPLDHIAKPAEVADSRVARDQHVQLCNRHRVADRRGYLAR
jgi:hypothetical protein